MIWGLPPRGGKMALEMTRPALRGVEFRGKLLYVGNKSLVVESYGRKRFIAKKGGFLEPTPTSPDVVLPLLESGNYFPIIQKEICEVRIYACPFCSFTSTRKAEMRSHIRKVHQDELKAKTKA